MLKRYQILLDDWMADHYKLTSQEHDVSFSEMIRMALCSDILQASHVAFPKHKINLDKDKLKLAMQAREIHKVMDEVKFHEFLSQIYFEVRKATELWSK